MADCIHREPRVLIEARSREPPFGPWIPLVFGRCKRAKRLCAASSGIVGSFDEVDRRVAHPWITLHAPPRESQREFDASSLEVPRGLEPRNALFRVVWCQGIVSGMRFEAVLPSSGAVESRLRGWFAVPVRPEGRELAFKKSDIGEGVIPLAHHPHGALSLIHI